MFRTGQTIGQEFRRSEAIKGGKVAKIRDAKAAVRGVGIQEIAVNPHAGFVVVVEVFVLLIVAVVVVVVVVALVAVLFY